MNFMKTQCAQVGTYIDYEQPSDCGCANYTEVYEYNYCQQHSPSPFSFLSPRYTIFTMLCCTAQETYYNFVLILLILYILLTLRATGVACISNLLPWQYK